ncbi:hypothetical protein D6D29_05974 [Aureobasidium pullulans]|nr:hypothetical protein D6D29_05974 [Aureobasidium pullulans]
MTRAFYNCRCMLLLLFTRRVSLEKVVPAGCMRMVLRLGPRNLRQMNADLDAKRGITVNILILCQEPRGKTSTGGKMVGICGKNCSFVDVLASSAVVASRLGV